MYLTLYFTSASPRLYCFERYASVSFDRAFCVAIVVVLYLLHDRCVYQFTLKISEAAFSYYTSPQAHSRVPAAQRRRFERRKLWPFDGRDVKSETFRG